jgi:hypothetical protein
MKPLIFFLFFISTIFGKEEISALYLSWYDDPTTTMTIQWLTPLEDQTTDILLETSDGWISFSGTHHAISLYQTLVHTLSLTRLTPDTEYRFQLKNETYSFRTLPSTLERPVRFIVGGDAFQSAKRFSRMNRTAISQDPDFVVIGGDIAYAIHNSPFELRSSPFRRWISFLTHWKEQMTTSSGRLIPLLLVAGNHDIAPDDYELFFSLFAFPQKQLYRSVDFGSYLSLILLDTGHFQPIEGRQTIWLKKTLETKNSIPYRFAVYHEGAYPTWYPYLGTTPKKIRAHWCPLFDKYNLPIAFENHNHAFKRTFPIKANKIDESGTIYLGDGAWGVPPRKTFDHWYLEKKAKKNCIWLVELREEQASFKALDLVGNLLDEIVLETGTVIDPSKKDLTTSAQKYLDSSIQKTSLPEFYNFSMQTLIKKI